MLLASIVAISLHADPTAWVTVSLRSGVSRAQALELARSISTRLAQADPKIRFLPAEDLSSCNAKVPCLMARGRAAKAEAMVCIETGNVLDDQIVNVSVLSVEEDGKRIAQVVFEGPRKQWDVERVDPLIPELKHLLGLDAIAPPPPAPEVAAPLLSTVATPTPAPVTEAPPVIPPPSVQRSTSRGPLGFAAVIAGAVGLTVAGSFGIVAVTSGSERTRLCPVDAPCSVQAAHDAWHRAALAQTGGWIATGVGAALLALGAVFLLLRW